MQVILCSLLHLQLCIAFRSHDTLLLCCPDAGIPISNNPCQEKSFYTSILLCFDLHLSRVSWHRHVYISKFLDNIKFMNCISTEYLNQLFFATLPILFYCLYAFSTLYFTVLFSPSLGQTLLISCFIGFFSDSIQSLGPSKTLIMSEWKFKPFSNIPMLPGWSPLLAEFITLTIFLISANA